MTIEVAKRINRKYKKKICWLASDLVKSSKQLNKYKVFKKEDLILNDIRVIIDGIDTTCIRDLKYLNEHFYNYKTFEIIQYSHKFKKWITKQACRNTIHHDQGIIKECNYYQVPLRLFGVPKGIPLHRIVYVWFNGEIQPYNKKGELMDICHKDHDSSNNHISNLKWDTRKNNLAERKGATNQWKRTRNYWYEKTLEASDKINKYMD